MSRITEDDFGSDFSDDDDDDEFLALTLKPTGKAIGEATGIPTVESGDQSHGGVIDHHDGNNSSAMLAAKGEIAILRAKLEELNNKTHQEYEEMVRTNAQKQQDQTSRIEQLQELVKKLESEKKFLAVEMRNLSHKKRKRPQDDSFTRVENEGEEKTATPEPVTPASVNTSSTVSANKTVQSISAAPQQQRSEPVKLTPVFKDDNSLLIDSILAYTIPSTSKPVVEMLSKVALSCDFELNGFLIPQGEPLKAHLVEFLLRYRPVYRIDAYVTKITHFISQLAIHLFQGQKHYQRFPIPYLLALIHATILFKPSTVTKNTTAELIESLYPFLIKLHTEIKPLEVVSEQYIRHKRVGVSGVQFEMVDHFIMVFTCDLIESLLMISMNDHEHVRNVVKSAGLLKFMNHAMNQGSNLNIVMSVCNWLTCIVEAYNGQQSPLSEHDIKHLTQIVENGVAMRQNWLFHGLNRIIGNNFESQQLEALLGTGVTDCPQVIYSLTPVNQFPLELKHEKHLLQVQSLIVSLFTKLIVLTPNSITHFNDRPDIFRSLVFSIGILQERIHAIPRSPTTHMRSGLISSLIRLIHLIWEVTTSAGDTTPALTKDTIHVLMIVLARVAFSANDSSKEAQKFLLTMKQEDTLSPVFNPWAERRALQLIHIDVTKQDNVQKDQSKIQSIVEAQVGFGNGVEFAYDDDVVECARDILEKCTTMDEVDALYMAMNVVEPNQRDEEMIDI